MAQKIIIVGNLGSDPVMKYTKTGTSVVNMSVATSEKVKQGEVWVSQTTWWRVTVWGKMGEACNKYLLKGNKVYVEGTIIPDDNGNPRIWKKDDGTPAANFELKASSVEFLTPKAGGYDIASEQDVDEVFPKVEQKPIW